VWCLVARKTRRQERDALNAQARADAERDGYHYSVCCMIDGTSYGPVFRRSLEDADRAIGQAGAGQGYGAEIPADFHSRRATLSKMRVWVERFANGTWVPIEGSTREVFRARYDGPSDTVTQVTSSSGVLELTFTAMSAKSVRLELVQANSNWWSIDEFDAMCVE
jgi:hypothetical protein